MNREAIYGGVFAFFQALTVDDTRAFALATRTPGTWDNAQPEEQPALLFVQEGEQCVRGRGLPAKWKLSAKLWLSVHTGARGDDTVVSASILNGLLDAIEAALAADDLANNTCTIGGLVYSCAIEGQVQIFTGDLSDMAVALVPISIEVPT